MFYHKLTGSLLCSRLLRPVSVFILIILLLISYIWLKSRPSYSIYETLDKHETLQSRRFMLNSPENKYILFKQLQGAGFNNQAQEILLFHHLALLTSRVYVYQPLIWRPRGTKAKVPLSAFLSGVTTRGSISAAVFEKACTPEDTKHVSLHVNHKFLWQGAKVKLGGPEKCIVVDNWILNWDFLASPALHDLWPDFQNYLENYFQWSTPINAIAARAHKALNLRQNPSIEDGERYIALHFRRGDFEGHCQGLAERRVGFTTWATLPSLKASIYPPSLNTANFTSVIDHCYPSLYRIVEAIDTHVHDKPHLRTLHILHDGAWDHPLVYAQRYKLESMLTDAARAKRAGWIGGPMKRVTHSGQIPIQWGEADWSVMVDMELGRRADIFIGNGYSSLSTQIIALRLGADKGRVNDIVLL